MPLVIGTVAVVVDSVEQLSKTSQTYVEIIALTCTPADKSAKAGQICQTSVAKAGGREEAAAIMVAVCKGYAFGKLAKKKISV